VAVGVADPQLRSDLEKLDVPLPKRGFGCLEILDLDGHVRFGRIDWPLAILLALHQMKLRVAEPIPSARQAKGGSRYGAHAEQTLVTCPRSLEVSDAQRRVMKPARLDHALFLLARDRRMTLV